MSVEQVKKSEGMEGKKFPLAAERPPSLKELIQRRSEADKSFHLLEKKITLKTGEIVTLSSMHIERMRLFRGSTDTSMKELEESKYTTVGYGVYLTSQKEAAVGYAFARSSYWKLAHKMFPTVYEVEIANVNILNLSTKNGRMNFMKFFRQELAGAINEDLPDSAVRNLPYEEYNLHRACQHMIAEIDEAIRTNKVLHPKDMLYPYPLGKFAREILMREGYDGIMAIEGGESGTNPFTKKHFSIGHHDSYVIFQSRKVKIIKDEEITR